MRGKLRNMQTESVDLLSRASRVESAATPHPASFRDPMRRAWNFVAGGISEDGALRDTYVGWAVPAEKRQMQMRAEKTGWVVGFILVGASGITAA